VPICGLVRINWLVKAIEVELMPTVVRNAEPVASNAVEDGGGSRGEVGGGVADL
jgi:hypothetical protein